MKIALLNGPNLNLLGLREPELYGNFTLGDVEKGLKNVILKSKKAIELICLQSNHEGELIDFIQQSKKNCIDYIIFNPGAYSHTSLALYDAIIGVEAKVIEVHISNIYKREPVRQKSYIAPAALGQISGLGIDSYLLALQYIINQMGNTQ